MGKKVIKLEENEVLPTTSKKPWATSALVIVLITCTEPSSNGKMEVEMHYEGDESLAAFLVENACSSFRRADSGKRIEIKVCSILSSGEFT